MNLDLMLRVFAVSQLLLTVSLAMLGHRDEAPFRILIGFCLGYMVYLLIHPLYVLGERGWTLWVVSLTASMLITPSIYGLSTRLFFPVLPPIWERGLLAVFALASLVAHGLTLPPIEIIHWSFNFLYTMVVLFGGISLWAVLKDWKDDLVEPRRRLRLNFFSVLVGLFLAGTIIKTWGFNQQLGDWSKLNFDFSGLLYYQGDFYYPIEALAIGLMAFLFNLSHWRGHPDSIWQAPRPKRQHLPLAPNLGPLMDLMEIKKIFTEEGLTVGRLARRLGVSQKDLRCLINRQLGFENFNDFLNQYRVKEAARLLAGEQKVLDIAFAVGFSSLAPFNRTFKKVWGQTPSLYRESLLVAQKEAKCAN
ncbi:MAG: hypothetical protein A2527_10610 [Candidatus Lambdaproteobacteria bacterium RIFOXYD2_FULL_50_16]|uniref:HTH araC/xylS-type domain-containing protein n=1 Tax=Candidatus Lambdaproteobacteria bacterium RIFOXYD2_FULL_50_16 TaxID=1817772 RepID=A0A1F6GGP6_9PROT|nr:MAG: hypothetical protein A2527_10610 [Candidatus Lambdaproteobacteria bacterium RIFOXYD2_FULL_50_16]